MGSMMFLYTPLRNPLCGLHGVYNLIEVISSWIEQNLRSILKYDLPMVKISNKTWTATNYNGTQCLENDVYFSIPYIDK
jgi:hypothetical protein